MGINLGILRGRSVAGIGLAVFSAIALAAPPSRAPDQMFRDGLEGVAAGPFYDSDASRFLAQATFGTTDEDIAHLRSVGYQAWLNEQYAAAPTHEVTYLNWITTTLQEYAGQNNRQEAWFLGALGGKDPQFPANAAKDHKDQLRQRVAFALSEIFVISDNNGLLDGFPVGMAHYYDILTDNAFGNFRTLLEQVTLSPEMGVYLNMLANRRADLSQNLHPDENYAREINQLFGVGLVMLNLDGTPKLQNGQPIPTYTQNMITNFAHVFTGWNWSDCDASGYDNFIYCGPDYNAGANFLVPMAAYETKPPLETDLTRDYNYHDNGTHTDDLHGKQLMNYLGAVNGGVLADGGTAASDLTFALDNIYHHPNVAPFISKQLIQRLVTSNPSPAYVQRVATVFNANRTSATQLRSVVQAILLDPEARVGQWWNSDTYGKLREPLLVLTHFWRAMHAKHMCGLDHDEVTPDGTVHTRYANQPYRYAGYSTAWGTSDSEYGSGVAQASLDAFTVFNFFRPGFVPSGEMSTRSLLGPEFQQQTDSVIANTNNGWRWRSYGLDVNDYYDPDNHPGVHCDPTDLFGDVKIDHAQDVALAGSGTGGPGDPSDALVDAYNLRFMSGQMSPYMRQALINLLNPIDQSWAWPNGSDWRLQRVYRALYLILSSPEYMVQK